MTDKTLVHICTKEAELNEMHFKINAIYKVLMDNGQPGLVTKFQQLQGAIKILIGLFALMVPFFIFILTKLWT